MDDMKRNIVGWRGQDRRDRDRDAVEESES